MKTKKNVGGRQRTNRLTGDNKKWLCHDHRGIDEFLDCMEVLYLAWHRNHKISADMSREMLKKLESIRDSIKRYSEKPSVVAWEFPSEFWRN
jgi:hypothetical protein